MNIQDFADLIDYALNQIEEEKIFQRWLIVGQHMSLDDFKKELTPPKFREVSELMADIEKILNGGRQNGNI